MKIATLIAGLLLLSAPSVSSADVLSLYSGGEMSFDYDQFPFGPVAGTFHANGDILELLDFPPTGGGACTGATLDTETTDYFAFVAGVRNPDNSIDLTFIHIRSDAGISTESYQFDPVNQRVLFGFIDDATAITMPEDLVNFDFRLWLDQVEAKHKFTGALGNVTFTSISPEGIEGSFDGILVDTEDTTLVSISNAMFRLSGDPLPVEDESWGSIKGRYQK